MTRFPQLLHITEEVPERGDPWLEVHKDGVFSLERAGQQVAIYKLVQVGRVKILKSFLSARRTTKK